MEIKCHNPIMFFGRSIRRWEVLDTGQVWTDEKVLILIQCI